jgi:hypothetical protein
MELYALSGLPQLPLFILLQCDIQTPANADFAINGWSFTGSELHLRFDWEHNICPGQRPADHIFPQLTRRTKLRLYV